MSYDAYSSATTRRLVRPAIISAAYAYDLKFSCALHNKRVVLFDIRTRSTLDTCHWPQFLTVEVWRILL